MVDFKLSELKNKAKEVKIIKVLKNEGDEVQAGEDLFEVEAAKATLKLKSNANGVIKSIAVAAGQMVKVGELLAQIEGEVVVEEQPEKPAETKTSENKGFNFLALTKRAIKRELESEVTIIGGGPGGYVAALKAAQMGAKVVLVEKDKLGGTCLNWGCIPTKALARSAEVYNNIKEAKLYGCSAEKVSMDMKDVVARKSKIVNRLVQGIEYLMEKNNVEVVYGQGLIKDPQTVKVTGKNGETTITSKNIIIATGSKISDLPIKGADLPDVINSDQALELQGLPQNLVIIGGGVIGLEFAFIFNSFGVKVTVVEYLDRLLAGVDAEISGEIARIAAKKGISVYTGSRVEKIEKSVDGKLIVFFTKDEEEKCVIGDKVLMATGRKPDFGGIAVEELGIELDQRKRGIQVNSAMQTNIPNIYAIGDVTDKIQLAHVASHQGVVAVKNILGESSEMDYTAVPSAIFTMPEIAAVGITEEQAKEKGLDVEIGKFPFSANGKVLTMGEEEGFIKIIKEKTTGKLVGSFIIGAHATDLIAELTLAVKNQLTTKNIAETIHAHPTTAEVVHEAALSVEGGALHFCE